MNTFDLCIILFNSSNGWSFLVVLWLLLLLLRLYRSLGNMNYYVISSCNQDNFNTCNAFDMFADYAHIHRVLYNSTIDVSLFECGIISFCSLNLNLFA